MIISLICIEVSCFSYIFYSTYFAFSTLFIFGFYMEFVFIFFLVYEGFNIFILIFLFFTIVRIVENKWTVFYGEYFDIFHEIESFKDLANFFRALNDYYSPLVWVDWDKNCSCLWLKFFGRWTFLGNNFSRN